MKYFKVKNFGRLQHYKDRSPPWIKLYRDVLNDHAFGCLQDASKAHLMLLWVFASQCKDGLIPDDPEWLRGRISVKELPDLQQLVSYGFLIPCEQSASTALASCPGLAMLETETETETDNLFDVFWSAYPRKDKKKEAHKVWAKGKFDLQSILADLERRKKTEQWVKDDGKFIPHAPTYLRGERWNDALPPQKKQERMLQADEAHANLRRNLSRSA